MKKCWHRSKFMIAHLDADAFFASVEQAADPRLRGRPVAVGSARRGIIASASYEARRFGIHTPMPSARALRLCPSLLLLPGDYEKYERFSRFIFSYPMDVTPFVEISGIDEGYYDLGSDEKGARQQAEVVAKISTAISQRLKISVSQGVATNKLTAQIASKLNKPCGFTVVPPGCEQKFLSPLDISWLPGVGPTLATTLARGGLRRIGQVAAMPEVVLRRVAGGLAPSLIQYATGIDFRPVVPQQDAGAAKSYGAQETFDTDTADEEELRAALRRLVDDAVRRMRAEGHSARTLSVTIRYSDMKEAIRTYSFDEPLDLPEDFYPRAWELLRNAWERRVRLRMIRARLSTIYNSPALPPLLEKERHMKLEALNNAVEAVRARHGRAALIRGHDLHATRGGIQNLPPPKRHQTAASVWREDGSKK